MGLRSYSKICLLCVLVNSLISEVELLGVICNKGFIIGIRFDIIVGEDVMVKVCKGEDIWRIRCSY